MSQLVADLVEVVGEERAREAGDGLGALLEELAAAARAAWPGVALAPGALVRGLAARVPEGTELAGGLRALRANELYLTLACAAGDEVALRLLEAQYVAPLARELGRVDSEALAADAVQNLRKKLLVGDEGRPPKLAHYGGSGELHGWLRVAALRELQMLRRRRPPRADVDELAELPEGSADPELASLRRRYQAEFKRGFAASVEALTPRERLLLRQQLIDRLTIDEMATLYRVHRATVLRWLAAAREALAARTREALVAEIRAEPAEVESIVRLIRSQLDLSLSRLFAREP